MELIPLLHQILKSEILIDLFETYDVLVVYEYDRTYEGRADAYWAKIPSLGLEFVFNKSQVLKTIFVYVVPEDELVAADLNELGIDSFPSKQTAIESAIENSVHFTEGETNVFDDHRDWIKYEYSNYSIHFEYRDSVLSLITLEANNA